MMKRSVMTLYSGALDIYSHQVRIVLAKKGVSVDILNVDANHPNEDLGELNPYNTLPTLVDRDLVLYNAQIIMEYLDERFPHPPLLPVYPVSRAKSRLMMHRIEKDWYSLLPKIEAGDAEARKELKNSLLTVAPIFEELPYFLSEEFTLVDCVVAPLLWRLPLLGIELPRSAKAIFQYQTRVFGCESFQAAMTEAERELRDKHDN
jgi:RNA polymerase-associated protein